MKRTFDILDRLESIVPDKEDMLAARVNNQWVKYSTRDYRRYSTLLAYGLMALGIKKGDRIATISNNRPEWNFMDIALSMGGFVHVPVYPTIGDEEYKYIFNHAEPQLVIVSDSALYKRISVLAESAPSIRDIYTYNDVEGARSWKELVSLGEANEEKYRAELEETKKNIGEDDLLTLLYTSGTTGMPKGVMLTHKNLVSNAVTCDYHVDYGTKDRALSFLPISHVYERMINMLFQYKGMSIYYAENMGTIARDAQEVNPAIFGAVPRLLENVYDKILGKGKDLKGITRSIFFWAVNLGLKYNPGGKNGFFYMLQLKIADKLVFSKWRSSLGGTKTIITGGAAIQPRLIRVFMAAGIEVYEGYGLTETSPVIAVGNQRTKEFRLGCAGLIIKDVEVKIAEDGEIIVRGPNVMRGYYKQPDLTKEAIDEDGYFHTGDIGEIVEGRFLKITDRKKEIFKLSSGKYIAPQAIENKFKESFFIEQLMVIGEHQKFASALISPNFHFLHNWAAKHDFKFRDNEQLIKDQRVIERFQQEVNELNKSLGQVERIKRFRLVKEEWSPATGEMSPTLKLKRKVLAEKYKDIIQEIYSVDSDKE
ncbi:MAG: AMP-dependent synthetase/ligase [Bacteroidota bacterium]